MMKGSVITATAELFGEKVRIILELKRGKWAYS